eukprot:maker-scaffold_9-snap-gene-8.54-mRNA-1 protein AED:0.27 eAED:0.27 QI:129/1/1/1/0.5/0.33/3/173/244
MKNIFRKSTQRNRSGLRGSFKPKPLPMSTEFLSENFQGKWITCKSTGGWEYVERKTKKADNDDAVIIVTEVNSYIAGCGKVPCMVLVEQFRPPLGNKVLEFPAGLCDEKDDNAHHTAARELVEETGYLVEGYKPDETDNFLADSGDSTMISNSIVDMGQQCPSSAGLTNETYTMVKVNLSEEGNDEEEAKERQKKHAQQNEQIEVVLAPKKDLFDFLEKYRDDHGVLIDSKVMMYAAALQEASR